MAEADARVIALDAAYCAGLLPRRDPAGHKGTFGTVVCVAGSLDYAGAGLLCSKAAARGGAGLVVLAVPRSIQKLFAGRVAEVVTLGIPEDADGSDIDAAAAGHAIKDREPAALVVGPGLRETGGYRSLVLGLLAREGAPMVIDGGALNLLSASGRPSPRPDPLRPETGEDWWVGAVRSCVLTPHAGEFARLTGSAVGPADDERSERCAAAARKFGQVVVLKGARTVVCAPDGRRAVAPFANAALATAGSGDVLAGLIGGLMAQGVAPFDAACLGVFLHGRAGELVSKWVGDSGLLASDLHDQLAIARRELEQRHGDASTD